MRGLIIIVAALLFGVVCSADARGRTKPTNTQCEQVRELVARVGRAEAERMARNNGLTEAQIRAAKTCL